MPPRVTSDALGEAIRSARDRLGLTQEKLATALGWSQAKLSDLERGRSENVGMRQLVELSRELGIEVGALAELASERIEVTPCR